MNHPIVSASEVDVTLFVPCYNEEENIVPTLQKIAEACRRVGCSYEVIIIDDGSTDQSVARIRQFLNGPERLHITLIQNPMNMGLAYNFTEAAFLGHGKYYRLVCGDDIEPVETQVAILALMGKADLIIPYPLQVLNKSRFRLRLSSTYTHLVNALSGNRLRYYNGCGLFYRYHVMRWHAYTRGFGFQAWLLTRLLALGYNYTEIGCHYNERRSGKSRALTLKNFLAVAHTLLSIFLGRLTVKRIVNLAGGLGKGSPENQEAKAA